jgi:hypothetical protein
MKNTSPSDAASLMEIDVPTLDKADIEVEILIRK